MVKKVEEKLHYVFIGTSYRMKLPTDLYQTFARIPNRPLILLELAIMRRTFANHLRLMHEKREEITLEQKDTPRK